jgi:hypothetical protein
LRCLHNRGNPGNEPQRVLDNQKLEHSQQKHKQKQAPTGANAVGAQKYVSQSALLVRTWSGSWTGERRITWNGIAVRRIHSAP